MGRCGPPKKRAKSSRPARKTKAPDGGAPGASKCPNRSSVAGAAPPGEKHRRPAGGLIGRGREGELHGGVLERELVEERPPALIGEEERGIDRSPDPRRPGRRNIGGQERRGHVRPFDRDAVGAVDELDQLVSQ